MVSTLLFFLWPGHPNMKASLGLADANGHFEGAPNVIAFLGGTRE